MRGVPIGPPSRSGYALRLGARIRPTALRSFLPKPESETSLLSVVTSVEVVIRRIHIADAHRL